MAKPVLIYDDRCQFCCSLLDVIKALDSKCKIDHLGGYTERGRKIREERRLKPGDSDTIILITDRGRYTKSDALFQTLRILGGFCKVLSYFRFTPRFIRDGIYDLVAQNRHILSGKSSCRSQNRPESSN
jgi:predicted DCC family thiol-disulfide oxidoreductase YuxK